MRRPAELLRAVMAHRGWIGAVLNPQLLLDLGELLDGEPEFFQ